MGRSDASLFAGAVVGVGALFWLYQRHVSSTEPEEPLAKEAVPCRTPALALAPPGPDTDYTSIKIVYGTVTGTARLFALELADQLRKRTADKVRTLHDVHVHVCASLFARVQCKCGTRTAP